MIKIELFNQETKKTETFTETFIPARQLRNVLAFGVKAEKEEMTELEQIDEMIAIVAGIFKDDKVNFDSILDGVASDKLNAVLEEVIGKIMGEEEKKQGLKQVALEAQK